MRSIVLCRYATPDRLLQRLTDLRFLNIDFLNTFLITYRVFTDGITVLEALKKVFFNPDADSEMDLADASDAAAAAAGAHSPTSPTAAGTTSGGSVAVGDSMGMGGHPEGHAPIIAAANVLAGVEHPSRRIRSAGVSFGLMSNFLAHGDFTCWKIWVGRSANAGPAVSN